MNSRKVVQFQDTITVNAFAYHHLLALVHHLGTHRLGVAQVITNLSGLDIAGVAKGVVCNAVTAEEVACTWDVKEVRLLSTGPGAAEVRADGALE